VSKDNASYCAADQRNAVSLDGANKHRTHSTTVSGVAPANSTQTVVSADVDSNSCRRGSASNLYGQNHTDGGDQGNYHAMRSIILILALSLHHLFEGISLGLQRTVTGAFMLLIALLCHETIISFSLGLQFVKCGYTTRKHYITAFVCSIIEPIGVAVGTSPASC